VLRVKVPWRLMRYLIAKGSVALDGVSLTIQRLRENSFEVALIPHTAKDTTLGTKRVGDLLNFEADMLAKLLVRALRKRSRAS
jgi:riboflavin synthase